MTEAEDAIYLLRHDDSLERLPLTPYANENLLQELIAKHSELLAGAQIDTADPLRWMLVAREAGVPDDQHAPDRWSADHVLLDQRGVPTFVEVKRSSNPEIRREIIGQMLEYAANATTYWPADRLRMLAALAQGGEEGLLRAMNVLLSGGERDASPEDIEQFWRTVDDNLRDGQIRLLFIADALPRELRRVIEFLNEHMPRIEVLGIEVRQFAGQKLHALVPRVVGQTERARSQKSIPVSRTPTTLSEFTQGCPESVGNFFRELIEEAGHRELLVTWGSKGFSLRASRPDGELVSLRYGYPRGTRDSQLPSLEIYLKYLSDSEPASSLRRSLLNEFRFRESGKFTLWMIAAPANLDLLRRALPAIWETYRQVQRNPSTAEMKAE